jgi:hypothetical protein
MAIGDAAHIALTYAQSSYKPPEIKKSEGFLTSRWETGGSIGLPFSGALVRTENELVALARFRLGLR